MAGMDQFSSDVQGQALMSTQQMQPDVPFAFKVMENYPSASSIMALNARKYSNTMFKGGYLDTDQGATGIRSSARRAAGRRTGAFVGGNIGNADDFAFGKSFAGKSLSTRLKPATMANINPLRFDTVSRLSGFAGKPNPYTPFQGISTMVSYALKLDSVNTRAAARFGSDVINNTQGNPVYTGGVFGRLQTADRADDYVKAISKADDVRSSLAGGRGSFSQRRTIKRGESATKRLRSLEDNIIRLGKVTNADFATQGATNFARSTLLGPHVGVSDDIVAGILKGSSADDAIRATVRTLGHSRALYDTLRKNRCWRTFKKHIWWPKDNELRILC